MDLNVSPDMLRLLNCLRSYVALTGLVGGLVTSLLSSVSCSVSVLVLKLPLMARLYSLWTRLSSGVGLQKCFSGSPCASLGRTWEGVLVKWSVPSIYALLFPFVNGVMRAWILC